MLEETRMMKHDRGIVAERGRERGKRTNHAYNTFPLHRANNYKDYRNASFDTNDMPYMYSLQAHWPDFWHMGVKL